jgi:hypothetical protein
MRSCQFFYSPRVMLYLHCHRVVHETTTMLDLNTQDRTDKSSSRGLASASNDYTHSLTTSLPQGLMIAVIPSLRVICSVD